MRLEQSARAHHVSTFAVIILQLPEASMPEVISCRYRAAFCVTDWCALQNCLLTQWCKYIMLVTTPTADYSQPHLVSITVGTQHSNRKHTAHGCSSDISNQVISQQDCAVCMSDFSRANFKCSAHSLSLLSYSFSFITFLGSFGSTLLFFIIADFCLHCN